MQDAIPATGGRTAEPAEPEDEIPAEFRVPEPEPVIAGCGVTRKTLLRENGFDAVIAVYAPTRLVIDAFTDHPLRAAFWAFVCCVVAWSIYDVGWRRPYRVEITRTTLRWRSLFRQVEVPLLSVRALYPAWVRNKGRKLVVDGPSMRTRKLSLRQLPDVDPFMATLLTAAPGIGVHVSALSARRQL
jgi:hypothetical protein